ncbi:MAG: adenylate/guanylate cyclase domain-containing protein [Cyanobacteriota bacterium]|nr:adenylate/guanylate cyclase domain-containing protein [Cyanobacteriota bacterium]
MSVLFCDMVGATTLSEQIDPEDFRELLCDYHSACSKEVQRLDGFLADLMGDGVVIYFGYPKAHEDDEIRAVRCGLAIQQAVQNLSLQVRHPFEVRIGVHRGRVVVGALGGASGIQSLAIGETPNIAARLQGEARPGDVVVSDSLWRLISQAFHGEPLGARRLKGIQRPVEIHRILGYRGNVRRKGTAEIFIGRQAERELIRSSFHAMLEGQRRVVLIRGEPGIGKSRLVQQIFSDLEESSNLTVMEAFCSPFTTDTPYFPLAEMLINRLSLTGVPPADQFERLRSRVVDLGLPEREALPLFALFLSIEFDPTPWAILKEFSLARQRQRTLELLFQGFKALTSEAPVLLIIEDLHWADASTIEFLDQLFQDSIQGRFMVILTARLQFNSSWNDVAQFREIFLEALIFQQAEDLIRTVASGKAMPPELVRQICLRADGNPLFLEEITTSVISSSSVVERESTWELVQPYSADVVPASMEVALMARLDQTGEAKCLLQIGATLGREFSLDLLAAVVSTDRVKVEQLMLQMVDQGFLRIIGSSPPIYIFKHALVQDVAYQSLLLKTREEHHSRIAVVMAEQFPDLARQRPELLAHHLSGAGNFAEAAVHWQAAGQMAADRNAVNEAVEHLNRGLVDLDQLPQAEERWQRELGFQLALAPVQMAAYGWASSLVETTCKRAIDLADRLCAEQVRFAPLWGLWSNQFVGGRLVDAMQTCRDVLALAQSCESQVYAVPARHATSYTMFYRGEYAAAIKQADTGLAFFDFESERQLCRDFQLAPTVNIMTAKASSLWMLGYQSEAVNGMQKMLDLAHSLDHPPSLAAALAFWCHFSFYDRDWYMLRASAEKLLKISTEEGFAMWRVCASMFRSQALLKMEPCPHYASQLIEDALLFRQTDSMIIDPSTSCMLCSAYALIGRVDEALEDTYSSLAAAMRNNVKVMIPEILRVRGELYALLGELDQADAAYQLAIDFARDQQALSLELRSLICRLRLGKAPQQAILALRGELRQVVERMSKDGERPDLIDAKQVLDEIK